MTTKIGSLVMDIFSSEVTAEEKELIAHPLVGGVILFSKNYEDKSQLAHLCSTIRKIKRSPILIMVDQEGGRVQRFVAGFTKLPAFSTYGELYEKSAESACNLAREKAQVMASELIEVGIDLSLSPVLDLNKGLNTVIGDRAFHSSNKIVTALGRAFIQGMENAGMAAVAKHFPGHGSVTADSHYELPIDNRTLTQIEQDDLIPFQMLAPFLSGMMASHVLFPAIDKQITGFSPFWLKHILREKLGFKNVILTDDLNMKAATIAPSPEDRFLHAKEAGCDFILFCNDRMAVITILDRISSDKHMVPQEKWQQLQHRKLKVTTYDNSN